MVEHVLKPDATADSRRRAMMLGLLGAAQMAFAASFSPQGVRSGDWEIPGLPGPDFLVFVASGATLVHPLVLYPLWAGLGYGNLLRRFAATLLLFFAFSAVAAARGLSRGFREPQVIPMIFLLVSFSLTTLGFWSLQRCFRWCIGVHGARPIRYSGRARPVQFRLRHLFECVTLSACLLALYRFHYADGLPTGWIAGWREQLARHIHDIPLGTILLLPASFVAWAVLAFRGRSGTYLLCATAAAIGWAGLDCTLVWFVTPFTWYGWPFIAAAQFGAGAAGLISAVVLRSCGYRIFRRDLGAECPA